MRGLLGPSSNACMMAEAARGRTGRALLGAASGIVVSFALALGLGTRACLDNHPKDLLFVTAQSFAPFAVIYVLPIAIVVGIVIGWFTQPKLLLGFALGFIGAAFAVGYVIGPEGGCIIFW